MYVLIYPYVYIHRCRAVTLIGEYNKLDWANRDHQATSIRITVGLLSDSAVPVVLEAAKAISRLIRDSEVMMSIRRGLLGVIQGYYGY